MKKIVFVAGDKSGDLYAGLLCKELQERFAQQVELHSFGGPSLARYSRRHEDLVGLSVSGIIEVAAHLKELAGIFNRTAEKIKTIRPDLLIFVDFPDFNLRLAKKLHGICPFFYYISPQIWAWRGKRIHTIKALIDKIIVLFDFEQELYRRAGVDALFFGHPMLDIIPAIEPETENTILFLPGSRQNEIKNHLPLMENIKTMLTPHLAGYSFHVMKPDNIEKKIYKAMIGDSMKIVSHSYDAIAKARFIIASSGTATLELAILNVPFCIVYKMHLASWYLLKHLVRVKFIGLPNIVCNEKIAEEFIQFQARPENISSHVMSLLSSPEKYAALKSDLAKVKDRLTPYHAIKNTVSYLGNYLALAESTAE